MTGCTPEDRERKRAEDSNVSAWILVGCIVGAALLLLLSKALS